MHAVHGSHLFLLILYFFGELLNIIMAVFLLSLLPVCVIRLENSFQNRSTSSEFSFCLK